MVLSFFHSCWRLAKVQLCGLIGCSAAFGGAVVPGAKASEVFGVALGVLVMAMAGATINSLQERKSDGLMRRTAARPLVRHDLSVRVAVALSILFLFSGLLLLTLSGQQPVLLMVLSGLALLLYNGLYTPLKKKTVMALLIGAVCGGLPPVIGWVGSGGDLTSYLSLLLFIILFLWQVPHFCLILLMHKEDYLLSQQPSLLRSFSERGIHRVSVVWTGALVVVMMLFPLTPAVHTTWQALGIFFNSAAGGSMVWLILAGAVRAQYRTLFFLLNMMLALHMLISGCSLFVK